MAHSDKERVLITGAAGFLGSYLCDKMLSEGFEVIGMDNLSTGCMDNIAHLADRSDFEFVRHDVSIPIHVSGDIHYILCFASPASPLDYLRMPIETLKTNSLGAQHCLDLCEEKKARILVASTSEVYGDPKESPQKESYWGNVNPIGARGVYDEAKRYMEALTMAYHKARGLNTGIVRIFNTYGPRMRIEDGRALPNFLAQSIRGEDITLFGDGSQTRSFCYVSDLVEGVFRLLMSDYHLPVNIGNDVEISLKTLAEEVVELTKTTSSIVYKPLPQDDPKQRKPDLSRAREILGYSPKVERAAGLRLTYEYFLSKLLK